MNLDLDLNIEANNRTNPILDGLSYVDNPQVKRITSIALPFLNLWQPTAMLSSVGVGIDKSIHTVKNISKAFDEGDWKAFSKELFQLALTTATVALTVLGPLLKINPLINLAITQCYQLALDVYTVGVHIYNNDWLEAGKTLLNICHTLIYIASVVYAAPELIAISMLAQAGLEIYKAYDQFNKEDCDYLAIVANILMAGIRIYQATPHLKTTHRNWLGQQMSQTDWDRLTLEIKVYQLEHPDEMVDFESYLIKHYYSSYIKDINLANNPEIRNVVFANNTFKACDFTKAKLVNTVFQNVLFDGCYLSRARFIDSTFLHTNFKYSTANETEFNGSKFHDVTFKGSDISQAFFNEAVLDKVSYVFCKMTETNFFRAKVYDSSIIGCDLTDTLLLGNKDRFTIIASTPNKMTRPVVALSWNFNVPQSFAKIIGEALKEQNALVLKYDYTPSDIDPVALEAEVKNVLANYKPGELSRAQYLFQNMDANSQIAKTMDIALDLVPYVDAIQLPGGADIEPEFYGAVSEPNTHTHPDKRRSVLDFAIISLAEKMKVPTQGICRGAQLINVYFGGTMKQHVDNHHGALHWISPKQAPQSQGADMVREILGDGMVGLSMHHQAIDKVGDNLQVLAEADGVIKIVVSKDGVFLGSQIHPEISMKPEYNKLYYFEKGKNFFKNLLGRASDYKSRKESTAAA